VLTATTNERRCRRSSNARSDPKKEGIVTTGKQIRQEGIAQGRREGECAVLLRQLRRRFGDAVDTDIEQRIAMASTEQLDTWTERVWSAATLTELLAD
jgi:Domain of unknown function (DUF4351)